MVSASVNVSPSVNVSASVNVKVMVNRKVNVSASVKVIVMVSVNASGRVSESKCQPSTSIPHRSENKQAVKQKQKYEI